MARVASLVMLCIAVTMLGVFSETVQRSPYACQDGQFWSGQTCQLCKPGCTCNSYMGCDNPIPCKDNQTPKTLENGSKMCVTCPAGCSQCTIEGNNGFKCQKCMKGYDDIQNLCVNMNTFTGPTETRTLLWGGSVSSNSMYQVPYSTAQCSDIDDDTGMCEECSGVAFINEYGVCENCPNNCKSCQSRGTCNQCNTGFYWTYTSGQASQANSGAGACMPCSGSQTQCGTPTAIQCFEGTFLANGTVPICTPCSVGCSKCQNAQSCQECSMGYFMNNNVCQACPGNQGSVIGFTCMSCNNGKATSCDTCMNSTTQLIVEGQCKDCATNVPGCTQCAVVNNTLSCTTCMNGYYRILGANNLATCSACPSTKNFYRCEQNDNDQPGNEVIPTQCSNNYFLVNDASNSTQKVCTQNTNNCLTMKDSSGNCTACQSYLVLINGKCQTCPMMCEEGQCSTDGTKALCNTCMSGYFLSTDKSQCTSCGAGCTACSSATACTTCGTGYRLNNGVCQQCTVGNCAACAGSAAICDSCMETYFLYTSGTTQQCNLCPPGCADCLTSMGAKCTTCSSNYYQTGDGCFMGAQYCAVYKSDGTCQLCQYGAYLSNGNCYPCVNIGQSYICGENAGFTSCFGTQLKNLLLIVAVISIYFFQ